MNNLTKLNREELIRNLRFCFFHDDKEGAWTQLAMAFASARALPLSEENDDNEIFELRNRISGLENELGMWREKYEKVKAAYAAVSDTLENVRRYCESHS